MNEIYIQVIRKKNPEELAKEIENFSKTNSVFASPIIQDLITRDWVSFVYYRTLAKEGSDANKMTTSKETTSDFAKKSPVKFRFEASTKKQSFTPSTRLLEKWKKTNPSVKTLELLKKKGFSDIELKAVKTQYDCYVVLESLKGDNI